MHAKTPVVSVSDSRGLGIASVSYLRNSPAAKPEALIHRQFHDTAGRPTASYDPRLYKLLETEPEARPNLTTILSLTGGALRTDNVDAGTRLALFGIAGQYLLGWDSLHTQVRTEYDALMRPVRTIEQTQGSPARNSAFYSYGDNTPESALRNQCGQLIRHDDDAGTVLFDDFALTGGVVSQTRHFLKDLNAPDWPVNEADRDLLNESGSGATTGVAYNALGVPILQEDAQHNIQYSDLDVAGQLRHVRLKLAGQTHDTSLLYDIRYGANGNVERQIAGNGVISEAFYHPQDGRLMAVKAGLAGQAPLQDLTYEYDRVGNILSISDATLGTRFFRNQKIEPLQSYVYDSLYRLIEAHGWQRSGSQNGPQEPIFVSPPDPGQLENYRQVYSYDHSGNLTALVHTAASHGWTQRTAISKYSNRGLAQKADGSLPDETEIAAGFDANGNKKQLQAGQDLGWYLNNRLRQVDQVVRKNAPNDSEIYVYDGAGLRKRKVRLAYSPAFTRTHEVRYLPDLEIRTSPEEQLHVISVQAGRCAVQVLHWESGGMEVDQYRYNLTNHLGSSTLELDDRANLISEEMYYPYGGTSWWAGPDKVQASYKTRRYSGQERDATGLYYYGQRYYAPWLTRWISADPAGAADGLNLFAMVHGNPVRFVDVQGLWKFEAAGATAGREFTSALVASTAQYAVTAAVTAILAPMNATLTAAGAITGVITGAIGGYSAANRAQSTFSVDSPSSLGPPLAKIGGAVIGAALGAAPSLVGLLNPTGNQAAAAQIGSLFGTAFRELSAQYLAHIGSSNPSVGFAAPTTIASSVGVVGGSGALIGYAGAVAFGNEPWGQAAQSVGAAALATGVGLGGASAVRELAGTPSKPSNGKEFAWNTSKGVVGASSRHFFASMGQLANQAIAQIPGYSALDPTAQAAVSRAVGNAIGELRSTFVTYTTPGLSAELGENYWDVESNGVGTNVSREAVPVSFEMGQIPTVTDSAYYVSETRGRRYSRSQLNTRTPHITHV